MLGFETDEDKFSPEQLAFLDDTRRGISVALQRGNAQTIIRRSHRDRIASGRGGLPIADWGLGSY